MVATGKLVRQENKGEQREYTPEEVRQHNKDDDCWLIIHGKVYDVQLFLEDHPGGPEIMQQHAGEDCSQAFDEVFHSEAAIKQLDDYIMGTIKGYVAPAKKESKKTASKQTGGANPAIIAIPLLIVVAALVYQYVL